MKPTDRLFVTEQSDGWFGVCAEGAPGECNRCIAICVNREDAQLLADLRNHREDTSNLPKHAWNLPPFQGLPPRLEEAREIAARRVAARVQEIYASREKLLEAWIAETGVAPSESMLVEQHMADGTVRVHVKRKDEPCGEGQRKETTNENRY